VMEVPCSEGAGSCERLLRRTLSTLVKPYGYKMRIVEAHSAQVVSGNR